MKIFIFFIKLLIVFCVIYLLFKYNIVDTFDIAIFFANKASLILVFIIMMLIILSGSYKWWLLLKSQKYNIPFFKAYLMYSSGLFFNIFMPGGAGGDMAKGYYLYSYVKKSKRTSAIFSIIVDRVVGLHALLSVSFFSMLYYLSINKSLFEFNLIFIAIGTLMGLSIIAYSLLQYFLNGLQISLKKNIFKKINFISNIILKLFDLLKGYGNKKNYIFKCWIISISNHLMMIICFLIISGILNIQDFNSIETLIVGSLSLIVNTVPLTPGGIGIGESAFNYFSTLFNKSSISDNIAYGSIFFITYRILFSFVCLIGAVAFIILKKPKTNFDQE